jgi:hypothetical protein
MLPYLEHWDESVRNAVCHKNTAVDAAMCLGGIVRTLVEKPKIDGAEAGVRYQTIVSKSLIQ